MRAHYCQRGQVPALLSSSQQVSLTQCEASEFPASRTLLVLTMFPVFAPSSGEPLTFSFLCSVSHAANGSQLRINDHVANGWQSGSGKPPDGDAQPIIDHEPPVSSIQNVLPLPSGSRRRLLRRKGVGKSCDLPLRNPFTISSDGRCPLPICTPDAVQSIMTIRVRHACRRKPVKIAWVEQGPASRWIPVVHVATSGGELSFILQQPREHY